MPAKAKSAIVSIIVTAIVLVVAAQGAGAAFVLVETFSGDIEPLHPFLSPGAMILAGVIMGAWIRSRHQGWAGVALLAALTGLALNGALNYVGGDPSLALLAAQADAQPAVLIGAAEGVLLFVLVLWAGLLVGGLLRRKPA
jgi:hypothetical protein